MEIARGTRRGREERRRRDDRYDRIATTTSTATTDMKRYFFLVVRIVSLLKIFQVAPAGRYESLQYAHKKEEG